MSWDAREDNVWALCRGFGITQDGRFFAYPDAVALRLFNAGLVAHDEILKTLVALSDDGDELATRALAEAMRRRMTK